MKLLALLLALFPALVAAQAQIPAEAKRLQGMLIREAHFVFGLGAPINYLAGQITQESNWRPGITAWDNGRGLAQFMDPTAAWAAEQFKDLGKPEPYNPLWAIRAMTRLDAYNVAHIYGDTACDSWGAALKGYNAGLGYVKRAQKQSKTPGRWFGVTEQINAGQSAKNFEYSRQYPRWIIGKHAPKFAIWGHSVDCDARL